jgi:hypothetical protein
LVKIDEALPFGKLPEDEITSGGALVQVANFGAGILSSGMAIGGALAGGMALSKGAKALGLVKEIKGGKSWFPAGCLGNDNEIARLPHFHSKKVRVYRKKS